MKVLKFHQKSGHPLVEIFLFLRTLFVYFLMVEITPYRRTGPAGQY